MIIHSSFAEPAPHRGYGWSIESLRILEIDR